MQRYPGVKLWVCCAVALQTAQADLIFLLQTRLSLRSSCAQDARVLNGTVWLSEGKGIVWSKRSYPSPLQRYWEINSVSLCPGCEDIIVESISLESLISILKWSSQPYGSKWVHRQAMHFLCEEFSQVMTSDVLYELTKDQLLVAIQSDYLQVQLLSCTLWRQ